MSTPGEPCGEDAVCTSEHYCDDTGHCRRKPVGGEPCEAGVSCTDLSYCDVSAGVCQPRGSPGDYCSGSTRCLTECDYDTDECAPLYEEGDLCHYVGRECAPGLQCREDAEGRSRCHPLCRP